MNYFCCLSKNTSPLNMAIIKTSTNNAFSWTTSEIEYIFVMILGLILGYAAKIVVDSTTEWIATISIDEITTDDIIDLSWWIMCQIPSFLWYAVKTYVNLLLTLAIPETGHASGGMMAISALIFIGTIGRFGVWIVETVFTLVKRFPKHV